MTTDALEFFENIGPAGPWRDVVNTWECVRESNRIEGIEREPTEAEVREHERFVALEALSITELQNFVKVYQANARLRSFPGMNVHVGSHTPPKGGEHILAQLQALMTVINEKSLSPFEAHLKYEALHPFTDGNGRSGRAIWYAMMKNTSRADLGFLHAFYYQTLNACASNEEAQRESRAAEQELQTIRAKLVRAEQSGFVTPDRGAMLAEFKAPKPS